jgi:proton-coupled amino acid transporter
VPWFGDLRGFQIFFGMALFSFDGVSVILPIENSMLYPHDMLGLSGVLSKSMAIISILSCTFGGLGFLKYGNDIHGTIIHSLPIKEFGGQLILGSYALAILFSYALRFYIPMEIIRTQLLETRWNGNTLRTIDFLTITMLTLFIFGLAAAFPDLELIVSLLGAIKMTTLIFMAPALIDTASNWKDLGKYNWKGIKNGMIFVFGMIGMIMGTFGCAQKMIENTKIIDPAD